jgi:hypothetical protein
MVRLFFILSLILVINIQDLTKTKTAKDITVKKDTVKGKVIKQSVYQFKKDSLYFKAEDKKSNKLDSILLIKRK